MSVNTEEEFSAHLAKGKWVVAAPLQFLGGMLLSDLVALLFRARWVPKLCYLQRVGYLLFQSTLTSCLAWVRLYSLSLSDFRSPLAAPAALWSWEPFLPTCAIVSSSIRSFTIECRYFLSSCYPKGMRRSSPCLQRARKVERWRYGARIREAELPDDPLFIVGHFRSGTTLLHHLLALDPRNAAPTLHSCYHPHTFLLQEGALEERQASADMVADKSDSLEGSSGDIGNSAGVNCPRNWWEEQKRDESSSTWARPMDAVKESIYTPWEDEYALSLLTGGLSTYCGQGSFGAHASARIDRYAFCSRSGSNIDEYPSPMPPSVAPDVWMSEEEEQRWREAMLLFVKKQVVRYGTQRRLIFKSPMHTAKIGVLRDLFPRAKFVFIHRHPLAVMKSSERTYMQLLPYRQLEQPTTLDAVHEWLIRLYDRLHWPYLHCWRTQLLEDRALAEMSFKELTADKVSAIKKLYQELGMEWTPQYEVCLGEYLTGEVEDMVPGTRRVRRDDESGLFAKATKSVTLPVMAAIYDYDVVLCSNNQ